MGETAGGRGIGSDSVSPAGQGDQEGIRTYSERGGIWRNPAFRGNGKERVCQRQRGRPRRAAGRTGRRSMRIGPEENGSLMAYAGYFGDDWPRASIPVDPNRGRLRPRPSRAVRTSGTVLKSGALSRSASCPACPAGGSGGCSGGETGRRTSGDREER